MSLHTINHINSWGEAQFEAVVGPVFEKSPWIAVRTWPRRPFRDFRHLFGELCATVEQAAPEERLALIQAHPDLVGRLAQQGRLTRESAGEQRSAGLMDLDPATMERFADCNNRYRERFGFPFIICARLNSTDTILAAFEERLKNSRKEELARAWGEIQKIAKLRLCDLVEESDGGEPNLDRGLHGWRG